MDFFGFAFVNAQIIMAGCFHVLVAHDFLDVADRAAVEK